MTTLDGYNYIQHGKITSDSIRTCRSMSYHDLLCGTLIYYLIERPSTLFFHRVNTFSCAGNVAAVPGAGATGPDHQGRASSPSFTLPIHRPIHRAHCRKDLRDGREKTIQKEEVREVWLGCLEEEKSRGHSSLLSQFVLCCAGIHGRV